MKLKTVLSLLMLCFSFSLRAATWSGTQTLAADEVVSDAVVLDGTVTIEVSSGTATISGVVSGGRLVKTGAGVLVLTSANTYTGGTSIDAGTLQIKAAGGLGDGAVDITTTGAAGSGMLKFTVSGDSSFSNDINISGTASTVDYPAVYKDGGGGGKKSTTLTGAITASCTTYFRSGTNGDGWLKINGDISAEGQTIGLYTTTWQTQGGIEVGGKVTCEELYCRSAYQQYACRVVSPESGSTFTTLQIDSIVGIGSDVALPESCVVKWASAIANDLKNVLALNGKTVTIDRLDTPVCTSAAGVGVGYAPGYADTTAGTLVLKSTQNSDVYAKFGGSVSVVFDPTSADRVVTFRNRTSPTTGSLRVKRGTMAVADGATFAGATALTIDEGATFRFDSEVAQAFAGLTELTVNGTLVIGSEAAGVLNSDQYLTTVQIGENGAITLPSGTELYAGELWIDGVQQSASDYTSIDGHLSGGGVIHASGPSAEAVWDGGAGADTLLTTAANWQGDVLPDFERGTTEAVFGEGGERATVDDAVFFSTLEFRGDSFTLEKGSESASITLHEATIAIADAEDKTVVRGFTNEVPIAVPGPLDLSSIPTNTVLKICNLTAPEGLWVTNGIADSCFELGGSNVVTGPLWMTAAGPMRISGSVSASSGIETKLPVSGDNPRSDAMYVHPASGKFILAGATIDRAMCLTAISGNDTPLTVSASTTNSIRGYFYMTAPTSRMYIGEDAELTFEMPYFAWAPAKTGPGAIVFTNQSFAVCWEETGGIFCINEGTVRLEVGGNNVWGGFKFNTTANASALLDCRVNGMYTSSALRPVGFAVNSASTSSVFALNDTTQRVAYVNGGSLSRTAEVITGGTAALLEIGQGAEESDKETYGVKVRIAGGVGVRMNATNYTDNVCLLGAREYESTGDLIASAGTLELADGATWLNGSRFVADGGTLAFADRDQVNPKKAVLEISGNGRIAVGGSSPIAFAQVVLNGSKVFPGVYSAGDGTALGAHIASGSVLAGGPGFILVVR